MDPAFHEARRKFTKPKKQESPVLEKTKFQRLLARNPYALALATPPRECKATHAILPNFFLQGFRLVTHPGTDRPWYVPLGFEKKQPPTSLEEASHVEDASHTEEALSRPKSLVSSNEKPPPATPTGPTSWAISRQELFHEFTKGPKTSKYAGGYKRLVRRNSQTMNSITSAASNAVWREDMDLLVLELNRRRIVDDLVRYADMVETEARKYLIKCESWDDAKQHDHRGCLLFLGEEASGSESPPLALTEPPRLSTMTIENVRFNGKLVVHNLRTLLGEKQMDRLRQESSLMRSGPLFLLGRRRTIETQHLLWRLQGYAMFEPEGSFSSSKPLVKSEDIGMTTEESKALLVKSKDIGKTTEEDSELGPATF
ncbi:hypothetical protein B0T25DRAFT_447525 [Lasiosphaeria hispida]|uniref:Uncharacterized protein n=1 Tax=Lasiosphaeria hispida TaxID=260671 RepID=A0AAJ0MHW4_9PEZI|nr:hypothetical protein B0T25DRAFT_447525 [Lasiosphaeria hispida]